MRMVGRAPHPIQAAGLLSILLLSGCFTSQAPVNTPASPVPSAMALTPIPTLTFAPAPTLTPSPSATPAPAQTPFSEDGFRRVGYFPYWAASEARFLGERLPQGSLSHLNYAFALPTLEGECVSANASADAVSFPALAQLKQSHPGLKTLISVGGWGTEKLFDAVAENESTMARFATACAVFMRDNGFDGIDLDWEYPRSTQKEVFTALLEQLRRILDSLGQSDGRTYLLTIAAPAGPWQIRNLELDRIHPYLDWINLMTYDFYGSWSQSTGLNAPLYNAPADPLQLSVDTAVQAYLAGGVPPEKLLVGIPFYGRTWQGVADNQDGLFQPFASAGPGQGALPYREIKNTYLAQLTRFWQADARVPWLFDPASGVMISYEDPESAAQKVAYAREHHLGGVVVWELSADDEAGSLLNSLNQ